jgi:hypothetical protein
MLCPVVWCDPTGTALLMPAARPLTEKEREKTSLSSAIPDTDKHAQFARTSLPQLGHFRPLRSPFLHRNNIASECPTQKSGC